jgi:hypothetical protein
VAWVLVANGILKQEGTDRVALTPRAAMYTSAGPLLSMISMRYGRPPALPKRVYTNRCASFDNHLKPIGSMPEYFQKFGLKEPANRIGTIYSWAHGQPELTAWEVMNQDKTRMTNFSMRCTIPKPQMVRRLEADCKQ